MASEASNLPSPFDQSQVRLVAQGAEALVYETTFLTTTTACALKVRPSKAYRHPKLDARLTRARILAEARVLVKCARDGVAVPSVLGLDWQAGWLALEWIQGRTIRVWLDCYLSSMEDETKQRETRASEEEEEAATMKLESDATLNTLMCAMGRIIAQLHAAGIVHGDLTTSNIILREQTSQAIHNDCSDVVLIDFGLAVQTVQEEDRAVDLYVLERAFVSTHPQAQRLFRRLLLAYADALPVGKHVLKQLDEVRQRGRKKNMLG